MKTKAELRQHSLWQGSITGVILPIKTQRECISFRAICYPLTMYKGDPFASPSRVRIQVKERWQGFPEQLYRTKWPKTALEDALIRQFGQCGEIWIQGKGIREEAGWSPSASAVRKCWRSAAQIDEKQEISTFVWKWDFRQTEGRSMQENGSGSFEFLPECVEKALYYKTVMQKRLQRSVIWQRDQQALRDILPKLGLYCFCCKWIYSAARVRRFRPSDEKRSLFPVSEEMEVEITLPPEVW